MGVIFTILVFLIIAGGLANLASSVICKVIENIKDIINTING